MVLHTRLGKSQQLLELLNYYNHSREDWALLEAFEGNAYSTPQEINPEIRATLAHGFHVHKNSQYNYFAVDWKYPRCSYKYIVIL